MIDKKTKELILRYIDGEINDRDKITIAELVKKDKDVAQFYTEMIKLDQILEEDKLKPDEINLAESIMREIKQMEKAESPKIKQGLWNRLFPDPRWNVAYALILGIIIGFLIFSPFMRPKTNSSIDYLDEIGTIYDANAQPVFKIPLNLEGISAYITVHQLSNNFVKIIVEMTSDELTKIRFSFNESDFNVWTYKVIEQNFNCRILSNYSSMEVVNAGKNSYIIILKQLNHLKNNINIEVFSHERIVYQELMIVGK